MIVGHANKETQRSSYSQRSSSLYQRCAKRILHLPRCLSFSRPYSCLLPEEQHRIERMLKKNHWVVLSIIGALRPLILLFSPSIWEPPLDLLHKTYSSISPSSCPLSDAPSLLSERQPATTLTSAW